MLSGNGTGPTGGVDADVVQLAVLTWRDGRRCSQGAAGADRAAQAAVG